MKRIDIIAGARPNFMKIAPIIDALKAAEKRGGPLRYRLIHTGQHYDRAMSGSFFEELGIPDPDIKWNEERQHYDYGQINWDEFWQVVKGNGPCNKDRMEARVKAWEDGAWVREAATAYASKHTNVSNQKSQAV